MRQFILLSIVCSIIWHVQTEICRPEGSTRLYNSTIIQVCYSSGGERRWSFICDEDWDNITLNVYCRQVGYVRSRGLYSNGSESNEADSQSKCSGNERSLIECRTLLSEKMNCVYVRVNESEECRLCQADSECGEGICRHGRCECRGNCTDQICYQGSCDLLANEGHSELIPIVIIPLIAVGMGVAITIIGVGWLWVLHRRRTKSTDTISSEKKKGPSASLTIKHCDLEMGNGNVTESEEGLINERFNIYAQHFETSHQEATPYLIPSVLNKEEIHSLESELYSVLVEGEVAEYSAYAQSCGIDQETYMKLTLKYQKSFPDYETEICIDNSRTNSIYIDPPSSLPQLENVFGQCLNEIRRKDIQMGEEFASGQFGVVYRAVYHTEKGDIPVAIKTLKEAANTDTKVAFMREAAILAQFQHPNVLRMIGVLTTQQPYMMVTELLKTELEELLLKLRVLQTSKEEATKRMSYAQIVNLPPLLLRFCQEIAAGMKHLSEKHFIHRDLAARNVLVAKDLSCRIADFGMSRELHSDSEYYTSSGGRVPLRWTAPEAVFYNKYSEKSDVWSFGMTMYEIWSLGDKPWGEKASNQEIIEGMSNGRELSPPTGCPRKVKQVMKGTWDRDISSRPTFSNALEMLSGIQLPVASLSVDQAQSDHL